jgi:hypothetical protein
LCKNLDFCQINNYNIKSTDKENKREREFLMFCSNCGNNMQGGGKFCTECGIPMSNEITVPQQPIAPNPPSVPQWQPVYYPPPAGGGISGSLIAGIILLIGGIIGAFSRL